MKAPRATILVIEDNEALASCYEEMLQREGYEVAVEMTAQHGIERAGKESFDVVVTDLHLAGPNSRDFRGFDVIKQIHCDKPHLPIILMTLDHETSHAIEAHKLGAFDYIPKPTEPSDMLQDLRTLIDQALAASRLTAEPLEPSATAPAADTIIGHSRPMQIVYREIGRLAASRVDALIVGETGTGKELVARALHHHSDRRDQPLVAVNCAALPETLLESELFGHEKGAFTGADSRRLGRFEQANRGTIFLDEIGDMSLSTQAKLLRVLQEKSFQRLGGEETVTVDVCVIAATHHDLEQDIQGRRFRDDLYHRLSRAVIKVPPLRERREDIPALARFFLQCHANELGLPAVSVTEGAIPSLQLESWPGNVRELENVVCRALLLARGHPITPEIFKTALGRTATPPPPKAQTISGYIADLLARAERGELKDVESALTWEIERELYAQAIKLARGNQVKAAKWLGVSRPTMREKLRTYGLKEVPEQDTSSFEI